MAEFDWAATDLGPPEHWPQSLKTAVRIMLTSRQPMFVWWGPNLIYLYNDAHIAMMGDKHTTALGVPAEKVWTEIWEEVGARARRAMETNEGTYDEAFRLILERNGYPEETYFTFSYSPIPDDEGSAGGIFCATNEETARILSGRQIAALREMAARFSEVRSYDQAAQAALSGLEAASVDVPFALLYVQRDEEDDYRLAGTPAPGATASPPEILDPHEDSVWPIAEVLRTQQPVVTSDLRRLGESPKNQDGHPVETAVIVPIRGIGHAGSAILIAGLNPVRQFDELYREFIEMLAAQLAAGFSNADAHEKERARAEALAEANRAKTAFFANISHEFRTPLTLMLGPTEDALTSEEAVLGGKSLETVHRNQLRLLKLVNLLLDFSRLEAGRASATFVSTQLGDFTAELAGMFRSAMEAGGLQLEVYVEPDVDPVYVDRQMWEKVVLNLLSNAFKFTLEGKVVVSVQQPGDDTVEVCVRDTGTGIPADALKSVFERFHRVEGAPSRTIEGSGIGLALVRDVVELHGGTIEAESELGTGTTMRVTLCTGSEHLDPGQVMQGDAVAEPVSVANAEAYLSDLASWSDDPSSSSLVDYTESETRGRVLVADDNADMREYIAGVLRPRFHVRVVGNGREALEAVKGSPPDLLVTDVMMPVLDGFELLEKIRQDEATRNLPVIMLSARAGEEAYIEGLKAGADDYIVKPFAARELVARVESQVELGRLRARLEGERASLERLFMQTPVPIAVFCGSDLVFELVNPGYEAVVGRKGLLGKRLLDALPEIEGQEYGELLKAVMRGGEPIVANESLVRLDQTGSGELEEVYLNFIYAPVVGDAEGERVVAICNDVTDQVRARQKMQELAKRAELANEAKDEFLAMLGHELRNPLSPILTAVQLMRMQGNESREIAVIERQVSHLLRLVDDLLDISRITQGKVGLRKESMELSRVVRSAIEMVSPLLEAANAQLIVEIPEGLGVCVDSDRMAQVFSNILGNAAKYSESGGRIWVRGQRCDDSVCLSVRDEGVGIEPQMLEQIFELFTQQMQTLDRAKGGLGLGLAIVRSLVDLHEGAVSARSAGRGRGSEFVVELPWVSLSDQPEVPEPEQWSGRRPLEKTRVLVVDDNQDAAETLEMALTTLGYDVMVAHDGPSALERSSQFGPHIGLLDIGLPVMDGFELARRLRSGTDGPVVSRLVAVTGYGQASDKERARKAGFDRHMVKPVDLDELEEVIDQLTQRPE